VRVREVVGPSLISLYNLYPTASIVGGPGEGFSSGEAIDVMEQIAGQTLPPGAGYEWTAMSYQEKQVGNQIVYVFGFALLLVYLCLAGQYESWIAPLSVLLAVPLSFARAGRRLGRPRTGQQPLHADRPRAADRPEREKTRSSSWKSLANVA